MISTLSLLLYEADGVWGPMFGADEGDHVGTNEVGKKGSWVGDGVGRRLGVPVGSGLGLEVGSDVGDDEDGVDVERDDGWTDGETEEDAAGDVDGEFDEDMAESMCVRCGVMDWYADPCVVCKNVECRACMHDVRVCRSCWARLR